MIEYGCEINLDEILDGHRQRLIEYCRELEAEIKKKDEKIKHLESHAEEMSVEMFKEGLSGKLI